MPLYTARCSHCKREEDFYAKVDDRHNTPTCHDDPMNLVLMPARVQTFNAYVSPVDGSYIDDRAKHREHKKKHGLIEVGNEKLDQPKKQYDPGDEIGKELWNNW